MLYQRVSALHTGVFQLAHLFGVEATPAFTVEPEVEGGDSLSTGEIYKGIAHVALIFGIYGQIEKVVGVFLVFIDFLQEKVLTVLVWYVFDHNGSSTVRPQLR